MGLIEPNELTLKEMRDTLARGETPVCPGMCMDFKTPWGEPAVPVKMVHPDPPFETEWLCPECHACYDAKGEREVTL